MSRQFLSGQLPGQDFQFPGIHQPYNRRFIGPPEEIHKQIRYRFHVQGPSRQAVHTFQKLFFHIFMKLHQHLEQQLFLGLIKEIKGPLGYPHPPDQFIHRSFSDSIRAHAIHRLFPEALVNIFSFLLRIGFRQGTHLFLTVLLFLVIIILTQHSVKRIRGGCVCIGFAYTGFVCP